MKYRLQFNGRRRGAIGLTYACRVEVEAEDATSAAFRAYDTHEHIVGGTNGIRVTPLDNPPCYPAEREGSAKTIHKDGCYICEDPEFERMGLPLCYACPTCGAHVAADEAGCKECGY